MSGQTPPSSHSGDPLQPINPYEPSRSPTGVDGDHVPATSSQRHNSARLAWSDRLALLKSVAPTRISVVANFILLTQSLLLYLHGWGQAILGAESLQFDAPGVVLMGLGLLFIVSTLLGIYCNWLGWQYADRLQALAGGHADSFGPWCTVHYRWEWFLACSGSLSVAAAIGNWLATSWFF